MTIIDQRPELQEGMIPTTNPYEMDYSDMPEQINRISDSLSPYLTQTEVPNLPAGFSIYRVDASDPLADPLKAFEATVKEKKWKEQDSRQKSREEAAPIEGNSFFFVLLDENEPLHKIAATIRIADVTNDGPSETRAFFSRSFEDEIPDGLKTAADVKTWDVVLVAAGKGYNNGTFTPWVYHSLYRASLEEGVERWIANINDHEHSNLQALSIPFKKVSDHVVTVPDSRGKDILFRFYGINVLEIQESMARRIIELTKKLLIYENTELSSLTENEQAEAIFGPICLDAAKIALRGGRSYFDMQGNMNQDNWPPVIGNLLLSEDAAA